MATAIIERRPLVWVLPISAGIAGFLILLIYLKTTRAPAPPWVAALPALNAFFNSCSACALAGGDVDIKRGARPAPKRLMLTAGTLSARLLVSFLVYHPF